MDIFAIFPNIGTIPCTLFEPLKIHCMAFGIDSLLEQQEIQHHEAVEIRKVCPPYVQEDILVLGYDRPPQFEGSRDEFLIIGKGVGGEGDRAYIQIIEARFVYDLRWRMEAYYFGQ
jgi:hypothetical protein